MSLRTDLTALLGIPTDRCGLAPESRGQFQRDDVVIEKWIWTAEPGSRVPSVLYRPESPSGKMPAMVITCGHGGSKSQWSLTYIGQTYAKLGVACLVLDPIGEEERHIDGKLGTRAHDPEPVHNCADHAGRLIMGKLVFDTMRGIDFLHTRSDIDVDRIGVAGNSLGGAKATWMLALDERLKLGLVCGWGYSDHLTAHGKFCTRIPNIRLRERCDWQTFLKLAAPHAAIRVMNGDTDPIIDDNETGYVWRDTRENVEQVREAFGQGRIDSWFEAGGGHRPYHGYVDALEWISRHFGTPNVATHAITELPTLNAGTWCDQHGIVLERLYDVELHQRGATLPDLGLRPIKPTELACLTPNELGKPEFTIEGWLDAISG
ncbi:MAG: hypothetical protein CME19_06870 [Gemmatimonadetes bacterium]|nr:hypothetical protein [Gemmatimonadota bacterium]